MKIHLIALLVLLVLFPVLSGCGNGGGETPTPTPTPRSEFEADASTIALWHFNENSGQTAADISANNYHLVFGNDTSIESIDPGWTTGRFGAGVLFDGSQSQILNYNNSMVFSDQITVELWVRLTSRTSRIN